MRIQNVQALSFGALRYNCSKSAINEEQRKKFDKIEQDLSDTQYVDMIIEGEKLKPVVKTPYGVYARDFIPVYQDDYLYTNYFKVRSVWEGPNMNEMLVPNKSYVLSIPTKIKDIPNYEKMVTANDKYERGAILTRILDNYFIEYEKKNNL
ncbi:hypothetical protein IJ596_05995 [bacterium]|nr:hypothetical protein [bacterium]